MASTNEIKYRVALDGDDDVKRRLQAVAEVGKKSQEDIERRLSTARSVAASASAEQNARRTAVGNFVGSGSARAAVPSLAEGGGLSRLIGGGLGRLLGGGALGGLFGGLGRLVAGPVAPILTMLGLRASKISTDAEAAMRRLTALGGGPNAAGQLAETARKLGIAKGDLQPGFEKFLADFQKNRRRVQVLHGPGPNGELDFAPNTDEFLASQRALFFGARAGGASSEQAKATIDAFRSNMAEQGGLTSDVVRQLQATNPELANRLAKVMSPMASGLGGFANAGNLANYLEGQEPISGQYVNRLLAGEEPNAKRDAEAARGVSDAFDDLIASASRLDQAFSTFAGKTVIRPVDKAAVGVLDTVRGGVDAVTGMIPSANRDTGSGGLDQSQQAAASSAADLAKAADTTTGVLQRFGEAIASAWRSLVGGGNTSGGGEPKSVHFATGGPVRFPGGGAVSGPGTTTSDSIPAMLSDKEYVIKASSAKKIGRRVLDWLNGGAKGFADGGEVMAAFSADETLGPGDHTVLYDPQSGGAFVDNILRQPGDPILSIPEVRQAIEESKQGMQEPASKRKYKSDFTGVFGGHVFNTPGSYASGGAVGDVPSIGDALVRHFTGGKVSSIAELPSFRLGFSDGGGVDLAGGALSFPGISLPTFGDIAPPDIGDIAAPDLPHLGTVDLRTNAGDVRMHASTDSVEDLRRAARDSANAQIGRAPSWVYGRGR
jgi:hypothetical protein